MGKERNLGNFKINVVSTVQYILYNSVYALCDHKYRAKSKSAVKPES